jgi:hypothetical protein
MLQTKGCAKIMAVKLPQERWPDDRLDDLNKKVDSGFEKLREEMNGRFGRLDTKIDRLTYFLLAASVAFIAALIRSGAL